MEMPGVPSQTRDHVAKAAATTLNWGFRIVATLFLFGIAVSIARQDALESTLPPMDTMFDQVIDMRGAGFIGLSILAIIITPVITTLTIAIGFFRVGNRRYGAMTLVVLAILAISIAWSQR